MRQIEKKKKEHVSSKRAEIFRNLWLIKIEKQNRLRKWRKQNCEEAKEIAIQAKKYSKWKGLKTIFSPSISYSILDIVDEEIEVMVAPMMVEEKNGSPSEDIQQSTKTRTPNKMQEEGDEGNVDASLKIPKATVSVYKMLDWVSKALNTSRLIFLWSYHRLLLHR